MKPLAGGNLGRRHFLHYFRHGGHLIAAIGLWLFACASDRTTQRDGIGDRPLSEPLHNASKTMKLESAVFSAEGRIPPRYTCDGDNISPALHWDAPPDGTLSLALIVDDPDAPGRTFVHWVAYNVPVELRQLPENIPAQPKLPSGGIQGKNDFGQLGYGGPCPPSGTHRYFFKLYALDTRLDLAPGANKAKLLAAMTGHILASSELMGRYSRR